jgi:tetratricopeptide (TPR) repeat protein
MLGACYENLGQFEFADKAFRTGVELAPEYREPWLRYSEYLQRRKHWQESYDCALRAASISRREHTYLDERKAYEEAPYDLAGVAAYYLGRVEEAEGLLRAAAKLCPTNPRLQDNLKFFKTPESVAPVRITRLADIIIPHHNRHDLLARCLETIDNSKFNIIIVSGGSFGENCNKGAKLAVTDRLIFLNDDVVAPAEILEALATAEVDLCGVAQQLPRVKEPMLGIGVSYGARGLEDRAVFTFTKGQLMVPAGMLFSIRTALWERLGGFDLRFKTGGEDVDLGLRALERGAVLGLVPGVVRHDCSQSAGRFTYHAENTRTLVTLWPEERFRKVERLVCR